MQLKFREGNQTRGIGKTRFLLLALVLVVTLPSILFRLSLGSSDNPLLLAVAPLMILMPLVMISYVFRWKKIRNMLRLHESSESLLELGNLIDIERELFGQSKAKGGQSKEQGSILFLFDIEPALMLPVSLLAAKPRGGVLEIPRDADVTVWYSDTKLRSVEVVCGERSVAIEADGKLPSWASKYQ